MDIRHLGPGTTLYLPVGVEGALFSVGDTHAAQGDGEVCGTAIETAMDAVLRLSIRRDVAFETPHYDLPEGALARGAGASYHVSTGVGHDFMEAARDAVRATIAYLGDRHGLGREEAYALASVAADLRIHEVVDAPTTGWWAPSCRKASSEEEPTDGRVRTGSRPRLQFHWTSSEPAGNLPRDL
jgi:acetamidase/formamidase